MLFVSNKLITYSFHIEDNTKTTKNDISQSIFCGLRAFVVSSVVKNLWMAGDYSKYSFIRSKKVFSFLPGWGLKLGELRRRSRSSLSSGDSALGVHTFT